MFSEKLNFLIDMTGIKNSDLAVAVSLDASHISRLRNGARKLSKNQSYVMPMARYFAKHITESFKRRIVSDALHFPGGWPKDDLVAADQIYRWLVTEDSAEVGKIDRLTKGSVGVGQKTNTAYDVFPDASPFCYYGVEGKQNAVMRFLNDVYREEAPQTLLLFSDEELSWMYEDSDFAKEWTRLLVAILQKGNRIRIIHTISRDSNEMMEALFKWIPVYMTGSIEPYYYPKLRDGVFQRTMFIAPNTAAVISSSVKQNMSDMLNMYIVIPSAIRALVLEYERYLSLCRPLIDIMNATVSERYFKEIADFEGIPASSMVLAPIPSLMTMPEKLVDYFAEKSPAFRPAWERTTRQFRLLSDKNEFYEIILPPTKEQIATNIIPIPLNDFYRGEYLYYTVEQYKEHLKNAVRLSEENPHYHVFFNTQQTGDVMVHVKEDVGVVVSKTHMPTVVFTLREPNMTSAFWSYMQQMLPALGKGCSQASAQKIWQFIETL